MAPTVEYALYITIGTNYKSTQINRIEIIRDELFILYDSNGSNAQSKANTGWCDIVSNCIPELSFGTVLRFITSDKKLSMVSDKEGMQEIECSCSGG